MLKLPPLNAQVPIVDAQGRPTPQFLQFWQRYGGAIVAAFNGQQAALEAAGIALSAAETANTAAESVTASSTLANSSVAGLSIGATDAGTDATITISAHTRIYGDGSSVLVSGATITGQPYSTSFWIAYDDPTRAGGAVGYTLYTTVQGNGSSGPNRHFVGAVRTPDAGGLDIDGLPTLPPGGVFPINLDGGILP